MFSDLSLELAGLYCCFNFNSGSVLNQKSPASSVPNPKLLRFSIVPGSRDRAGYRYLCSESRFRPGEIGIAATESQHVFFAGRDVEGGCQIGGFDLKNAVGVGGPFATGSIDGHVPERERTIYGTATRNFKAGLLGNYMGRKREENAENQKVGEAGNQVEHCLKRKVCCIAQGKLQRLASLRSQK